MSARHRSRLDERAEHTHGQDAGAHVEEASFLLDRHAEEWKSYCSRVQNYSVIGMLLLCHTFLVFYRPATAQITAVARQTEKMSRQRSEILGLEHEIDELMRSLDGLDRTTSELEQMGDPETAQIKFESVDQILRKSPDSDTETRQRAIEQGLGIAGEQAEATCGDLRGVLGDERTIDDLQEHWLANIVTYAVGDADINSIYFGGVLSDTFTEAAAKSGFDAVQERMNNQIGELNTALESKRKSLQSLEEGLASLEANIERAQATLNDVLPTWADGIVDARTGVRFFPIALLAFACWLTWLSWRARVHFDYVRYGRNLRNLTRTKALASNTWTLVYRGPLASATTIGTYFLVTGTLIVLFEGTRDDIPTLLLWSARLGLATALLTPSIVIARDYRRAFGSGQSARGEEEYAPG